MTLIILRITLLSILIALPAAAVIMAQSPAGGATTASSSEQLVRELQALRTEFKQLTAASIRVQLLIARSQWQEQRINAMASEVTEVRRILATPESDRMKNLTDPTTWPDFSTLLPEIQKSLRESYEKAIAERAQTQQQTQQLRTRESELVNQITTEQRRWVDFHSQLDELERALSQLLRNP